MPYMKKKTIYFLTINIFTPWPIYRPILEKHGMVDFILHIAVLDQQFVPDGDNTV